MAKRDLPEINAGSMADIAFLLLIFFLVATTMDIDSGITRILPPMPEDEEEQEVDVRERNVMVVLINRDDQLMVGGQLMDLPQLREKTIEFFSNPHDEPNLPEKELQTIEFPPGVSPRFPDGIAEVMVSKGVVSLQNDRTTTYGRYLHVQNELVAAVNFLRNEFTMQNFGRRYDDLNPRNRIDEQIIESVNQVHRMNISEAEPKHIGAPR